MKTHLLALASCTSLLLKFELGVRLFGMTLSLNSRMTYWVSSFHPKIKLVMLMCSWTRYKISASIMFPTYLFCSRKEL